MDGKILIEITEEDFKRKSANDQRYLLFELFKGHLNYHDKNEERWGISLWLKNHQKPVAISCVIIGFILSAFFGLTISKVIAFVKGVNSVIP